eukprot:CAMPEP_0168623558 /NCGR_PEP_ID=MMETSP0449_2-20121227/8896_1 /TAXON_ID=1082188 /ORGANISM="Strombidium rassoulzadegani, Strain ras09" /LENGTH=158 /DNA_ID=CAMNT_0008664961 /DNA_START=172 /DNA_END=645 /DNA_ORIENTATION=-
MASRTVTFSKNEEQQAVCHFLYTFCILANIVVVCVYWGVIHEQTIHKHRSEGPFIKVVCQYMVHVVPALCCLANSCISKVVMEPRMVSKLAIIGFVYLAFNLGITKYSGKPVYDFLTWESLDSAAIALGIIAVFSGVYLAICKVDSQLKQNWFPSSKE